MQERRATQAKSRGEGGERRLGRQRRKLVRQKKKHVRQRKKLARLQGRQHLSQGTRAKGRRGPTAVTPI